MTNLVAEADKRRFLRLIGNEPPLKKPWFINLQLLSGFHRKHFNAFIHYLKVKADTFEPRKSSELALYGDYSWSVEGVPLVEFSFLERNHGTDFGLGMVIYNHSGDMDDKYYEPARKSITAQLKSARKTLKDLTPQDCSMVVLQTTHDLSLDHDDMLNVFYGTETMGSFTEKNSGKKVLCRVRGDRGIFQPHVFSRIAGVLVIDDKIDYLRSPFSGTVYPHLRHRELQKNYKFPIRGWRMITTDECSKGPVTIPLKGKQ